MNLDGDKYQIGSLYRDMVYNQSSEEEFNDLIFNIKYELGRTEDGKKLLEELDLDRLRF